MSPKSSTPPPAGGAAVEALLEPGFLEGAETRPMAEVRRLRRQAEQEEVNLSYTRRLLQVQLGKLDFVQTQELITKLMGKGEAAARRELMELHGNAVEIDI